MFMQYFTVMKLMRRGLIQFHSLEPTGRRQEQWRFATLIRGFGVHTMHFAFQVLKVKPGTVPICHFLPNNNLVWVIGL